MDALGRAFAILGKRWSGVILGRLADGPARFSELSENLGGISDSVLSQRLLELSDAGLVQRQVDPGPPIAVCYRLTAPGVALIPALHALAAWADFLPSGAGDPPERRTT